MHLNRTIVKFAGQSGQGINTIGMMFTKAINTLGLKLFSTREYPSLIKGGIACYQTDISVKEVNCSSEFTNILCTLADVGLHKYFKDIREGGVLICDSKKVNLAEEEREYIEANGITVIVLDCKSIALSNGGTEIMSNAVLLGCLWGVLNQDVNILSTTIEKILSKKNIDMEAERACINAGYDIGIKSENSSITLPVAEKREERMIISGNEGIALGALAGGMRAYFGYPMTPATSLFKYFGDTADRTKVIVKQAENEITAVQMALGSMYMGTRSLVATSGGGFDLMIESISCAGITETPLVIVLSQRVGAGTGVPTWTGSGDINTAVKGGHGDFPRCVIAVSDLPSSFTFVQTAFNIAEKYQMPVILLTEKQISESSFSISTLPKNIPLIRGLQQDTLRYKITESGISPRWIPDISAKTYLHNSDEHSEDGSVTEESKEIIDMSEKRARKIITLENEIPEPEYIGTENASVVFVGSGSSKNAVIDALNLDENIAYLDYKYIYPTKTNALQSIVEAGKRIILIENNQTGQLGSLITEKCGYQFKEKLLKFDGRPFFIDDILDFLNK